MTIGENSRVLARTWAYQRYNAYVRGLRKTAAAWFAGHGFATHPRLPYCLDHLDNWRNNIILPDVAEHIEGGRLDRGAHDAFPLHKYAHHGLSSQAMLFNLVGPLMVRDDFAAMRPALDRAGIPWPAGRLTGVLEYSKRDVFNEDTGQPTSIDFVLSGENEAADKVAAPRSMDGFVGNLNGAASLFIEAKLVEQEFGGCSVFADGDCDGRNPADDFGACYLHHIGRKYWTRLAEHGLLESPLARGPICPLASYYQFFREALVALHEGGHFVLLHDARNPVFVSPGRDGRPTRGLWPFLVGLLPATAAKYLHRVTIQDVIEAIAQSGRHTDWTDEFTTKYGFE